MDGHGVVVVWSTPKQLTLMALDLDGKPMRQRDLGPYVAIHGSASSPIIVGGMVVLANDQMHPEVMKRFLPKDASMAPGCPHNDLWPCAHLGQEESGNRKWPTMCINLLRWCRVAW